MPSSAFGFFAFCVGGVVGSGLFGFIAARMIMEGFRTGYVRDRYKYTSRKAEPFGFWFNVIAFSICFLMSVPMMAACLYIYVSSFVRQGTWPVARPVSERPFYQGATDW